MEFSKSFFQFVILISFLGWTLAASPSTCYRCQHGDTCKPPSCVCCGKDMPLEKSRTPQMVFFTFDDAVNTYIASFYRKLFDSNRRNPNGCPISMTLFISHANTVYSLVREFYQKGFEIASHSVTHSHPSSDTFKNEAEKQKDNLAKKARIPKSKIRGWRSPFLEPMGDAQPNILQSLGYSYDATLTISKTKQTDQAPLPFTLDYGWPYDCKIKPCPKSTHRGFWEVPVVSVTDYLGKYECVYVDGCNNPPPDEESAYKFLWENFNSYYRTNKAPFGINMHAAWFYVPDRLRAMDRFIQDLLKLDDVYIVSVKQVISWLKQPTPLEKLKSFKPWTCTNPRDRSAPKLHAKGLFAGDKRNRGIVSQPEISDHSHNAFDQHQTQFRENTHREQHSHDNSHTSGSLHHTSRFNPIKAQRQQSSIRNSYLFQRMQRRKAMRKTIRTTAMPPPPPVQPRQKSSNLPIPKPPSPLTRQNKRQQNLYESPAYSWQSILTNKVNNEEQQSRRQTKATRGNFGNISTSLLSHHAHSHTDNSHIPPMIHVPDVEDNTRTQTQTHKDTKEKTTIVESSTVSTNDSPVDHQISLVTTSSPKSADTKVNFEFIGPWSVVKSKTNSPVISSLQEWIESQKKQKYVSSGKTKGKTVALSTALDQEKTQEKSQTSTLPSNETNCKQGENCKLPSCFCKTTSYPTSMKLSDVPQIVYITIDGGINFLTYSKMKTLFNDNRRNPNGCRIGATFFANGRGSSYRLANLLYNDGIEIGLNGLQSSAYETSESLLSDINQQTESFRSHSAIPEEEIKGWRSPELFEETVPNIDVLHKRAMYDSSLVLRNSTSNDKLKPWPFTLDFNTNKCAGGNCSSTVNAGIWEVPVIPMTSLNGVACTYADKCRGLKTTEETVEYLMNNFNSYKTNKAPFGIHISRDWFYWYNNRNFAGLSEFIDKLLQNEDVYIVSVSKLLQWMKNPVSLSSAKSYSPWSC
ncbi:uncharacterized protein LOC133183081 [Saccostrea echinata]|uniref:uncharacterized protein LOC133183081 n=1 Tax=Saccostrea echinata TaxID=191078 RepID=UPI002A83631A|nr:uncharacterized protein LOC133183081 [Saccostrea echinata]